MKLNMLTAHQKTPVWEAPDAVGAGGETPPEPKAEDTSFIPDDFKTENGFDGAAFRARYDELVASEAERKAAAESKPKDPSEYTFEIPADISFEGIEVPEGFAVDLKTDDPAYKPLFDQLGAFMHEAGLPAEASGKMMGLLARYEATRYAALASEGKKQIETLGPKGAARVKEIGRSLENLLPKDQADALKAMTVSAAAVSALEKLLTPKGQKTTPAEPSQPDLSGLSGSKLLAAARAGKAA